MNVVLDFHGWLKEVAIKEHMESWDILRHHIPRPLSYMGVRTESPVEEEYLYIAEFHKTDTYIRGMRRYVHYS